MRENDSQTPLGALLGETPPSPQESRRRGDETCLTEKNSPRPPPLLTLVTENKGLYRTSSTRKVLL